MELFVLTVRRGEIYYADLSPVVGSEQGGLRPVLIVQNDVGNKHSPTVIAAAPRPAIAVVPVATAAPTAFMAPPARLEISESYSSDEHSHRRARIYPAKIPLRQPD